MLGGFLDKKNKKKVRQWGQSKSDIQNRVKNTRSQVNSMVKNSINGVNNL